MYVQSQSKTHSHVVHLFIVSFITLSYCWKFDPSTGRYHCNFPEHVQHGCYLAISAHNYCPYSNSLVPCICPQFCPISPNIVVPQIVLPFAQSQSQTQYPNSLIPQDVIVSLPVILVSLHRRINSILITKSNTRLIPSTLLLLLLLIFIPDELTTQLRLFDLLPLLFRCFLAS
jgi:hypothetical protein